MSDAFGRDRDYKDRGDRFGDRFDRDDRGGRGGEDDDRGGRGGFRSFRRRKSCRFCGEKDAKIDYRDPNMLKYFVSERGKIVPRRISGTCAKHQRELAQAIRRARAIALVPFTISGA
ncbi:MAG: 30S ribosomal protein S18 [Deltaproteobacteria bacterium]|nr:30S ribosomal protein S18 [Deltaproteobacteria bacterium]